MNWSEERYRLMIYFAVGTMHFYRKDTIPYVEGETLGVFAKKNKGVIDRVQAEALSLFDYELSDTQIGKAIEAYVLPGRSVLDTTVATRS